VIKTELIQNDISAKLIHKRYKDLYFLESAFGTIKSDLDIRPVYVRSEENTRGHVLVVMLAYVITKELEKACKELSLTVEEGLRYLSTLCVEVAIGQGKAFQKIPKPRQQNKLMLEAVNVRLPEILPKNDANVVTSKNRRNLNLKNSTRCASFSKTSVKSITL